MPDRSQNSRTILFRVLIGAVIGAVVGIGTWAVLLFQGMQATVGGLQSASNAPPTFLINITFYPRLYLFVLSTVGVLIGLLTGAFLSGRAIKKAKQVNQTSIQPPSDDIWPPAPTPPAT